MKNGLSLSKCDYAITLKRFLSRLLKQPKTRVKPILKVSVPFLGNDDAVNENETMTIGDLLKMPRRRLFLALDMIIKYDGNLDAAIAAEPDFFVQQ